MTEFGNAQYYEAFINLYGKDQQIVQSQINSHDLDVLSNSDLLFQKKTSVALSIKATPDETYKKMLLITFPKGWIDLFSRQYPNSYA